MKTLALLAATLLLGANSDPAIPQGQLIKSVDWDDAHSYSDDQKQIKATYFKAPDTGKIELTVIHSKTSKTLFTGSALEGIYPIADIYPIDLEKLTAGSYAILGEVRAEKDATGSSIVMWKNTENDNLPPVRALDATGNTFDLKPSDAWQPFWIPFDTKTARPIRLGVKLYLYGPGTFHFRNLRLVQYPDAPPAPVAVSASTPLTLAQMGEITDQKQARALRIIWFCLGVVATGLSLAIFTGFAFLIRRLRQKRHDRELRRIASLDS
jgi:hypothetical protein